MASNSNPPVSDDLDSFIADFMKCKMTFRNLQVNHVKLQEELSHEKCQTKRLRENEDALSSENSQMRATISSLHLTLKNLPNIKDENENLKTENKNLKEENEKLSKEYESETNALKARIQEIILNYTQETEKLQHNLQNEESKLKITKEDATQKKKEIDILLQKMAKVCEEHDQEKLNLQLEYQLKLSRLEKLIQTSQRPQPVAAHDIFRQKLQHMQKQHASEVASLLQKIKALEEEISRGSIMAQHLTKNQAKVSQSETLFSKQSAITTLPFSSILANQENNNLQKPTKPVRPTFRKRKLFLFENSYLQDAET